MFWKLARIRWQLLAATTFVALVGTALYVRAYMANRNDTKTVDWNLLRAPSICSRARFLIMV